MKDSDSAFWNGLVTDQARQLAWAVGSAPLLTSAIGFPVITQQQCQQMLEESELLMAETDRNPTALRRLLSTPKNKLLGFYFETLIAYWLRNGSLANTVHQGVTVHQPVKGELDLLFRTYSGWFHWELAVKFYLANGDSADLESWIGPGSNDRLSSKVRQLERAMHVVVPAAEQQLQNLGAWPVESNAFVKGYLFLHLQQDARNLHLPKGINADCLKGRWCRYQEARALLAGISDYWVVPDKPGYLGAFTSRTMPQNVMREDEMLNLMGARNDKRSPIMLIALHEHASGWAETGRIFVVGNNWPYTSTAIGS
jgi:hypothetical protein